jgi:sterol 3beta-glucosyltransferase
MILPVRDVTAVQRHRAYRFGYSVLVLVVKGHEEIFFELGSVEIRNSFERMVESRIDAVNRELAEDKTPRNASEGAREALLLRDLEPTPLPSPDDFPMPADCKNGEGCPPLMFRSTSSTFVSFRPRESLHITCLSIGSRGDVQPYIALCKGLMAEGHRCRIASHAEYQNWIEGHGIEFAPVGGDPAELMRICVEVRPDTSRCGVFAVCAQA